MKTSKNGIDLIKKFEGCKLTAYKCAAGKWTIGYGHTEGVKAGQTIIQAQAENFLKDDLVKFEKLVEKYNSKYHWNQNQFDALVSFAFNVGNIDQLTANGTRSLQTIAEKMLQYNKAGGRVLSGLSERRHAERALFLTFPKRNIQAASGNSTYIQMNYQPENDYMVVVDGLRIRTKLASQSPDVIPNGTVLGTIPKGSIVKNKATARVGNQIWMYIGTDSKSREQWVCADTGSKAYIE